MNFDKIYNYFRLTTKTIAMTFTFVCHRIDRQINLLPLCQFSLMFLLMKQTF